MKFAYQYATPDVRPGRVTGIRGEPEATLALIRATGFTGVEFLVRDPAGLDHAALAGAVARSGLEVPVVCTGEVYGQDGLGFADPDPGRRRQAIGRMKSAMELAARFGAMVNVGRLRGRLVDGIPPEQSFAWMREALAACAAAYPDTTIAIEPVNHHYANCLMSTPETLRFVQDSGLAQVGVMLDLVHMLVEGEDPAQSIATLGPRLLHFHVSDSERLPLGQGRYDIAGALAALAAAGYGGFVTVETFQGKDAQAAMRESWRHLVRLNTHAV